MTTPARDGASAGALRVAFCQPSVAHYRIPMYDLLGRQEGVDVTVFAGPSPALEKCSAEQRRHFRFVESALRPVRWAPGGRLLWQSAQLEVIDPRRFDLAIILWNARCLSVAPALRRARRRRMPVVLWGHGHSKRPTPFTDWLRNRQGRRADAVIVYTRTWAQRLVERWGYEPQRVFVAQNALDQAPIEAARRAWGGGDGQRLADFRAERGLDPARTIVFVSRLEPDNRVEMLIESLGLLRADGMDATLVVVGDGSARTSLERLAAARGLGGQVRFAGAIFDEQALAPWMLSAAVYAYPVNIGLSLMHAFGYGLPVITSDDLDRHGPEMEAFEDGGSGLLYRDGSVADLAATIRRLLEDEPLRARLGARALETVREKYTLPTMVQGFLDVMATVDGVQRKVAAP